MLIRGLWFHAGGSAFDWNLPSARRLKGELPSASRPPGVINSSADEWLLGGLHHPGQLMYTIDRPST